jgi:hypothetical protein
LIWEIGVKITMRASVSASDLDVLEPLWGTLQAHHAGVLSTLGDRTPARSHAESWARRRERYERWLSDDESFICSRKDRVVAVAVATPKAAATERSGRESATDEAEGGEAVEAEEEA